MEDLIAESERILERLNADFPLSRRPRLVWKNLRVSAGIAKYEEPCIVLSRLLLTDLARMESTLRHEYAHLLAVDRHGRKAAGHGVFWREAMLELGCSPEVRHQYPVERNSRRQEVGYRCKRCGATFVRGRRYPRGRRYYHLRCGGPVVLQYVRRVEPSGSA
jgi:SprT protein